MLLKLTHEKYYLHMLFKISAFLLTLLQHLYYSYPSFIRNSLFNSQPDSAFCHDGLKLICILLHTDGKYNDIVTKRHHIAGAGLGLGRKANRR